MGDVKLVDLTLEAIPGVTEVWKDALGEVDKTIARQEAGVLAPDAPIELTIKVIFTRKDGGQLDVTIEPSMKVPKYNRTGCTAKKRGRGEKATWKFVQDDEALDDLPPGVAQFKGGKMPKKEDMS